MFFVIFIYIKEKSDLYIIYKYILYIILWTIFVIIERVIIEIKIDKYEFALKLLN